MILFVCCFSTKRRVIREGKEGVKELWIIRMAYKVLSYLLNFCICFPIAGDFSRNANVESVQFYSITESNLQIGCGDLFENKVVDQFNDCAVTKKGCVPQKKDDGLFPVPPPSALVQDFNTTDFTGKWYITSGLNKTFDTFDCQLHEFSAAPNQLTGKLAWRIGTPDGGFFTRTAVQNFVQNEGQPGVLFNHGNEFLHYQDDW